MAVTSKVNHINYCLYFKKHEKPNGFKEKKRSSPLESQGNDTNTRSIQSKSADKSNCSRDEMNPELEAKTVESTCVI